MSRNIIIVGRGEQVTRMVTNGKNAKAVDYSSVVSENVSGATRINCLAVLVRTLEQLKDKKDKDGLEDVTNIYTISMVVDMVNRGTFKHWAQNSWKKNDGSNVNEVEKELWEKFSDLYIDLFWNVTIKDASTARVPRNPRYQVTQEQRALDFYVRSAWDRVKPVEPTVSENDEAI